MTQLEVNTEPETITELEATLIHRIHKMSIDQQIKVLEFLDTSTPESIEETPETAVEDPEPEMSDLERRQQLRQLWKRLKVMAS